MPQKVDSRWTDFAIASARADGNLRDLHPKARDVFFSFVTKIEEMEAVFTVTDAFRTPAQQSSISSTNTNTNTNAGAWQSMHNYGLAVDMYDMTLYPNANQASRLRVAAIGDAFGMEWGGRWTRPDYSHFSWPFESAQRTLRTHVNTTTGVINEDQRLTYDGRNYVRDIP